mmetsp:Transcript_96663/g.207426  ORF Transcript_96663/g.207426 Transcript_96663/m.207426 type:complete len:349 (-) Transcript_96663:221-1267(-)
MFCSLQNCNQPSLYLLTLHVFEGVALDHLRAVARVVILGHHLGNRFVGPEVLVHVADYVHGGHCGRAAKLPIRLFWGKVAILHAEGRDDAALYHGPVFAVIEAGHYHGSLGLSHGEDAALLNMLRQVPQHPTKLSFAHAEDAVVKAPPLLRILEHGTCVGAICAVALRGGCVDAQVVPIRCGIIWFYDPSKSFVAVFAEGEAVRGNDDEAHACQLAGVADIVRRHAAAAVHKHYRASECPEQALQRREACELASSSHSGALPALLHLYQQSGRRHVTESRLEVLGGLMGKLLRRPIGFYEMLVSDHFQGTQLPSTSKPEVFHCAFVLDVGHQIEGTHCSVGQAQYGVV